MSNIFLVLSHDWLVLTSDWLFGLNHIEVCFQWVGLDWHPVLKLTLFSTLSSSLLFDGGGMKSISKNTTNLSYCTVVVPPPLLVVVRPLSSPVFLSGFNTKSTLKSNSSSFTKFRLRLHHMYLLMDICSAGTTSTSEHPPSIKSMVARHFMGYVSML